MEVRNIVLGLSAFMLTAVAQAVTINNASFEDGFDNWNDDDPSAISSDAYSGSKSAKITGSGGRVDQTVTLLANTDYVLTAYVEDNGEIGVNLGTSTESTKSTSDDWNKVTVSFNSGSATSGEIFGKYYNGNGRFDDFSLVASGTTDTGDDSSDDDNSSDSNYGNECESTGKILYNGSCEEYSEVFEAESGNLGSEDHIISLSPIEMTFDALAAQHVTENGNGWRHEIKIKSSGDYRVGMTEVYEKFKATITAKLDDGAKTIVAQHHAATTATITKLYIADLDEGGFENAPDGTESDSVAMNGIFDVYIRLAKEDGSGETKHLLTTIRSGESFEFEEINDHGLVTVSINGQTLDSITVDDSSESYFKFGNYHQAQNPETGDKLASGDADGDFADFYAEYFDISQITFTDMSYTRTVD